MPKPIEMDNAMPGIAWNMAFDSLMKQRIAAALEVLKVLEDDKLAARVALNYSQVCFPTHRGAIEEYRIVLRAAAGV